jgi:hypothetical protein
MVVEGEMRKELCFLCVFLDELNLTAPITPGD